MAENGNVQSRILNRTYKDSVFTHLFSQPEYTLKLYQALHPEDSEITVNDIHNVTHNNVLVKDLYNDLGFCVKDKLIVLVESQSSWSLNIAIRALLYLSRTYEDYLSKHQLNLYSTKKINIPEPELYVVYTKERKCEPEIISFSKDFFGGKDTALDIKVKVLFGDNENDIVGEYVSFCKLLDRQVAVYGLTKEAIEKAIQICCERNILTEYLKNFKLEVIEMTDYLFNEEVIDAAYKKSIIDELEEEIREKVTNEVTRSVTDSVTKSVTDAVTKSVTDSVTRSVTNEVTHSLLGSLVNQGLLSPEQAAGQARRFQSLRQ